MDITKAAGKMGQPYMQYMQMLASNTARHEVYTLSFQSANMLDTSRYILWEYKGRERSAVCARVAFDETLNCTIRHSLPWSCCGWV